MQDKKRAAQWINKILDQMEVLDHDRGIKILKNCGVACSNSSQLIKRVENIRNKYKDNSATEILFKDLQSTYFKPANVTKNDNKITLIFEECTCPLVKQGVNNSYICNCTLGYTKNIFETLFGRSVEVRLLKSILKGDTICEQGILIKD